jgi:hypothetical protein
MVLHLRFVGHGFSRNMKSKDTPHRSAAISLSLRLRGLWQLLAARNGLSVQ